MPLEEIAALPIRDLSAEDCQLWLWTTNSHLHAAFHLIESWAFDYKVTCTWVKDNIGLGYWVRGQTEHLLLAVRGSPRWKLVGPQGATGMGWSTFIRDTLILKDRKGVHSVKPEKSYRMIEAMSDAPRLELFARRPRGGWTCWGDDPVLREQRQLMTADTNVLNTL